MKPYFSIVIPTLNEEKYLPKLLSDLSKQTFKDFEVVVVDGRSDDKTLNEVLKFKKKITLKILTSEKRNVSYQRNLGAKKGKGDWIIFMDADCSLPRHFLEGVKYHILLEKPDVFTCWMEIDDHEIKIGKLIEQSVNITTELVNFAKFPSSMATMIGITKKGFLKMKGFDEDVTFAEGWKFIQTAFSEKLKFTIFRDPRYVYSLRRFKKIGNTKVIKKYIKLFLKTILKIKIDLDKEYPMGGKYD